ncbi:hypothetical protein EVA_05888 [gut metagenome]|uniref:Uncharacterized protein n=1 Tax=gut metagenome TaxID=749906 RepID=J9GGD8_9ZZZZ
MSCCHQSTTESVGTFCHQAEFKITITTYTRIRRTSCLVFIEEITNDLFTKIRTCINDMMLYTQSGSKFTGGTNKVRFIASVFKLAG